MIIAAIVFLFILYIYLWASKYDSSDLPLNFYDSFDKVNMLYIAYMQPMVEEYKTLKGYSLVYLQTDSVNFGEPNERMYPFDVKETVKYSELEKKLEQLKVDMKRGCEVYCKETL